MGVRCPCDACLSRYQSRRRRRHRLNEVKKGRKRRRLNRRDEDETEIVDVCGIDEHDQEYEMHSRRRHRQKVAKKGRKRRRLNRRDEDESEIVDVCGIDEHDQEYEMHSRRRHRQKVAKKGRRRLNRRDEDESEIVDVCGIDDHDPEEIDVVGFYESDRTIWIINQWIAIAQDVSVSTSAIVPSQQEVWGDEVDGGDLCSSSNSATNTDFDKFRSLDFQLRFENVFTTSPDAMPSPLPQFNWADSKDVWKNMVKKETTFQRDHGMFRNHPELQPRMRSILLDWLSEVCEVYRLHKETFTLCVDFIDRYLSVTQEVAKTQLQLTGISALFIAAKLEEIYPPKLSEFAYVTDSACSEADIVRQEMIMLKALKWDLSPMTPNAWLGIYLQMANLDHIRDAESGFVFPQFSSHAFIQISRLCDLCLMDSGSLKFRYSVIAAAAMYHHTNEQLVMEVSSFNWADLYPCVKWMAPFAKAILEVGQSPIKFFPHVKAEDCHNIQTHNVDMPLVDRAQILQTTFLEKEKLCPSSLDLSAQLVCLLTPLSNMKSPCDNTSSEDTEHHS